MDRVYVYLNTLNYRCILGPFGLKEPEKTVVILQKAAKPPRVYNEKARRL